MTINTHDLGMSYLDDSQLVAVLRSEEGYEPLPYADTKGIPTIGIGVNLANSNYMALVLDKLGVFSTYIAQVDAGRIAAGLSPLSATESGQIYRNIVADFESALSVGAFTSALNAKLQSYLGPSAEFSLDETLAKEIKREIIIGFTVGPIVDNGKQARLDAKLGNSLPHDTKEYVAVMSLFFNAESLVGPGLIGALQKSDPYEARAEAWRQIRYVHEDELWGRRYREATLFSLTDPGAMVVDEARAIYRMYTKYGDDMYAADTAHGGVDTLKQNLKPAADFLINKYASGQTISPLNIWVADKAGGILTRDGKPRADQDNLFIGDKGVDGFGGGSGNDVMVGNEGTDTFMGNGGNDILKGGDGADTYIYVSSDGSDTIYDYIGDGFGGDGFGNIKYDADGLTGGIGGDEEGEVKEASEGGTFKSTDSDKKYTYSWGGPGSDLTINGSITVKNFKNGDLGITLYERKKKDPDPIPDSVSTTISAANRAIQTFGDPLTLDLNGDGIHTTPIKRPPLLFDINASGIQISTGWIAPDDGLLVMDRNGNGTIDSGAELFGDATPKYDTAGNPTTGRTADGFAALAQEDTNHDGVVDAQDANWNNLRVWQDLNQDGISQSNELSTLDEQDIASFNTGRTSHSQILPSGNQMADLGTFTRTDGSTCNTGAPQAMADINLALDTFHRTFTDTIPTTAQTETLPDMQGSGKVRDLQQAASLQTAAGQTLSTVLANYSSAGTREEQLARIDGLLAAWADSAGFGTLQSRAAEHGYTVTSNLSADWQKKLTILETFNGHGFFRMPWDGASMVESGIQGLSIGRNVYDPASGRVVWDAKAITANFWWAQLNPLEQAYAALRESVYQALLPQTRLKPYLDAIGYSVGANGLAMDFAAVEQAFVDIKNANPEKAVVDLLEFNRYSKNRFANTDWQTRGWQLLGETLNSITITPAIQKTLADFNVGMDGQPELIVRGGQDQVLIASEQGSTLSGGYGNDVLVGGAGDDSIDGGWGADILQGGKGDDRLIGGYGNDTYVYNRGDGADTIVDMPRGWWGSVETNTLQFGAGITAADVTVTYDSVTGNVVLVLGPSTGSGQVRDRIVVGSPIGYNSKEKLAIQQIRFSDGTAIAVDTLLLQSGMMQNGTDGADTLLGSNSQDYADVLNGGAGDDVLNGGYGNDKLNGGAGNDTLNGEYGNDILNGAVGNDVLVGGAGSDTYVYNLGDGADIIADSAIANGWWGYTENNTLKFGDGITLDMVIPRFDNTTQTVVLDLGPSTGSGQVRDSIDIGTIGGFSIQTLQFADGSTVAANTLVADQSLTQAGTEGADTLVGANTSLYRDVLHGLDGDDVLQGLDGNDVLDGGAGNDVLDGGAGNDTLIGGAGNDVLAGGTGSDVYVFNLGNGADTVVDNGDPVTYWWGGIAITANNVLNFGSGITVDMLTPRFDSTTKMVTLDLGNGDSIQIGTPGEFTIQFLQFADGTTQTLDQFLVQRGLIVDGTAYSDVLFGSDSNYVDHLNGSGGDDTLIGGKGKDVLTGGAGNDVLEGGEGVDTYVFNLGDGADTIVDHSWGNLELGAGISADTILPRLDGVTGKVSLDFGDGDSVSVGHYDVIQSYLELFIQEVKFADGSKMDLSQFLSQNEFLVEGTGTENILHGAMSNRNQMSGLAGDDTLVGGQRDDKLDGGTGNDVLVGGYGNDVLTGGLGNDSMTGGEGYDVYVYNLGDGSDVIIDSGNNQINTVRLGDGANILSVEYQGSGAGNFILHFGDGGSLRITGVVADFAAIRCPIQRFELADGSVLSAQQLFSQFTIQVEGSEGFWRDPQSGSDSLWGTDLSDAIRGYGGNDTLLASAGDDVLDGGAGNDTLSGGAGNDSMLGGEGIDILYGREGVDVLTGGMGNDVLQGGTGNDTYLFNQGDGEDRISDTAGTDVLRFGPGIVQTELLFSKFGVNLRITLSNGADSVVIENWFTGNATVNTLQFDDGSTFDLVSIAQSVAEQPVIGTAGNDTLVGSIYSDILQGGQGNDVLIGGTDDDVYRFNMGDGVDQIYELSSMSAVKGGDTIEFGAGITVDMLNLSLQVVTAYSGQNEEPFPDQDADLMVQEDRRQVLNIRVGSQGDAIQVMSGKGAIEKFRFADGSEYAWQEMFALQGGGSVSDSNDSAWTNHYAIWNGTEWIPQSRVIAPHRTLDGTGLSATFDGGVGNDTMLGGKQNDTYLFNLGDGQDVIADLGGTNQIKFGADVAVSDVYWTYDPAGLTPFVLNVGYDGDSIAILNGEHGAIQRFVFNDGTVLTFDELIAEQGGIELVAPSIDGQSISESYNNQGGNHLIVGGDGADTIDIAQGCTNLIVGGKGDDTIDTYRWECEENTLLFNSGDGRDTVILAPYTYPATLMFGADVDPSSVKVIAYEDQSGGETVQDMRINYGNKGDSIFISGSIPNSGEGGGDKPSVRVKFADGTDWSYADLMAHTTHMIVAANSDSSILIGTSGNDTYEIDSQAAECTIVDSSGTGNINTAKLGWDYVGGVAFDALADRVTLEDEPFSMEVSSTRLATPFTLSLVGGCLCVQFDNGVTLNIDGFDPKDPVGSCAIRNFKFTDGTVLSIDQILAAGIEIAGTDAADHIDGTAINDTIEGLAGEDTIEGGKGSDVLRGGAGNDTYVFNRGDGADTIEDSSFYWERQQLIIDSNVLRLGAGIDPSAVIVKSDPSNGKVYLDMGSGDSICVGEPGNFAVQTIQFNDGTVWDEWTMTNLMTIGTIAEPNAGQPTGITYSATLANGTALPSWLVLDGATGAFSGTPTNDDVGTLDLAVTGTNLNGGSTTRTFALEVLNVNDAPTVLTALQNISIEVGQQFSYFLSGAPLSENILSDISDSGSSDQVPIDYANGFYGTGGNDSYSFARGDGNVYIDDWDDSPADVVYFTDVLPADIVVTQDKWGSVILSVVGSTDSLTLDSWLNSDSSKIEQVVFADGSVWGVNDIQTRLSIESSTGADYITGTGGDDVIHALSGDDAVMAGAGSDTVLAGSGNDWVDGGGGSDVLSGGSGADEVDGDLSYSDTANDLLDGGAGNDYLYGSISSDLLIGGAGDDELEGNDGNDVLLFNRGDGNDRYYSWSENEVPLGERCDTVSLGGGIGYANLSLEKSEQDLILHVGNDESITFDGWFNSFWDFKAINTLQIVAEAMSGYDSNSTDPLLNKRIQQFDFLALVNRFETVLASNPSIITWQLAPHLADYYLGGTDEAAIGGDMAYLYGKNGNLNGLSETELRAQLNAVSFGTANQVLTQANPAIVPAAFTDVDFIHGDSLTYSATLTNGAPLPAWLIFDAATQSFSGTPDNADGRVINVSVIATDTGGLTATSNFVLTVTGGYSNHAPVAVGDSIAIAEGSGAVVISQAQLLANDTDPDSGDTRSVIGFDAVSSQGNKIVQDVNGNLVFDFGDKYISLAAGQTASDSFTYNIADAAGVTSSATVNVTINGTNDAPEVAVAIADQRANEDAVFAFTVPAGSFADIDNGDVLTYSATMSNGAALPSWLTFNATTQTFSGTPLNEDVGSINVRLTATDIVGEGVSNTFALNVQNVNDAPIANADACNASEDGMALQLGTAALLANDIDPDFIHGDVLNIVGVSQAASGAVVSLVNGAVQYDIGTLYQTLAQGQTATDTFTYTVSDAVGATSIATVTMTITGINDAPDTTNDTATVQEDHTLTAIGNVLSNDSDIDQGNVLSVANAGNLQGTYGNLVLNADGSYNYALDNASQAVQTLAAGQTVTETFTYQATDGLKTTPATLTVTIVGSNDAPVVVADTATVQEDINITASGNVLANDSDIDQGSNLTVANAGTLQGQYGSLVLNTDGSYTYALDPINDVMQMIFARQVSTDAFTYQATDGVTTTTATLTITINITGSNANAVADTLMGGPGNNTFVVDNAGDIVIENPGEGTDLVKAWVDCTLSANVENLTLTGGAITGTGNELNNILYGNGVDNVLYGLDGNDTLDGGNGADTLVGGMGNDVYTVNNIGDIINENLAEGTDRVTASVDYTLVTNVENLTLTCAAITGTGNELNNAITGNGVDNVLYGLDGNDTLNGGMGADTLIGGLGNDVYTVDNTGDTVTENLAEGTDTIQTTVSYTLTANVENLTQAGNAAITGCGNDLGNSLSGNSGNNWLTGLGGNDTVRGNTGNDILQGGDGNDALFDTAGANLLDGGAGTDTLIGNSGNEMFIGGTGNDTISTGTGVDILAFNRGDGADSVNGGIGTDNTITLGGGINYADIALSKIDNNLILEVGGGEQITLSNWFNTTANYKSVVDLQVMADAMAAFNPASGDPLLNQAVQNFDFTAIVSAFDQARGTNSTFMHWSATNSLLAAHLSSSDTTAIGGDLAHQYGVNGSLSGMSLSVAQAALNDAQFGGSQQTLNPWSTLNTGTVQIR